MTAVALPAEQAGAGGGAGSALHPAWSVQARRSARAVGVFFLLATAAGVVHLALAGPVLGGEDLLADVAAGRTRLLVGVLAVLVMAAAVVGVSVAAYPVLRLRSPGLALGYVAARTAEAVFFGVGAVLLIGLVVLADAVTASSAGDAALLADALLGMREWGAATVINTAVFPVGALIFYGLLYRGRLVPGWLAAWGFAGAVPYLVSGLLLALDRIEAVSPAMALLNLPLAVNELVVATWLIAKGYEPAALAALEDRRTA